MQKQARNKVYATLYFLINHLNGNYEIAEDFIEQNRDFLMSKMERVEKNELYLYEATLYRDHGKYDQAIKVLNENRVEIFDKIARNELLAELYIKSGKTDKAIASYEIILDKNPSSTKHYYNLFEAHGIDVNNLDDADREKIIEILNEKIEKHSKLLFLKRFLLNFLNKEEDFRVHFEKYCRHFLTKGIPSLVNDIENTIKTDELKMKVVKETFEKYLESMQKDLTIDGEEQDPMQETFLLFYLAQIRHIEGDYISALELIKECIEQTPTFVEAFQFKAKVFVSLGCNQEAEEAYIEAHSLDTADRFLNAELASYTLKTGKYEEANEIMKRWSLDQSSDKLNTFDLQNAWYEVESGNSHYKYGRHLQAYQMFNYIQKHIVTMHKDMYDLHFYTVRKFNLRTYLNVRSMQDNIRRNIHIKNGMVGYIRIINKFYKKAEHGTDEEKKEFTQWLEDEEVKHAETEPDGWDEYSEPHDPLGAIPDPTGVRSLKTIFDSGVAKHMADKCQEFLSYNSDSLELLYYSIPWLLRAKKYTAAISNLKALTEKDPKSPRTIYAAVKFRAYFSEEVFGSLKPKQKENIDKAVEEIFGAEEIEAFLIKNTIEKYPNCLNAARYYLKGLQKHLGKVLSKEEFGGVLNTLTQAKEEATLKCSVMPQIEEVKKLISYAPQEAKDELINAADEVYYNFKATLLKEQQE